MANTISNARLKQRSLIITLLDLKNAFGEVHLNLISALLEHHHVPPHIAILVKRLYKGFQTSVVTSDFTTPHITVERGMLLGDCLSPLSFNMCCNTFIQHIKSEKFCQLGFCLKSVHGFSLTPTHWFQFADDATVISEQKQKNQMLLDHFTVLCQCAGMIVRVDKCCRITIVGDSMLNGILDEGLQKDHNVQVKHHPGATTRDIVDYVRPVIRKKPDCIIIHAGTNDLTSQEKPDAINNFREIIEETKRESPDTSIILSTAVMRKDEQAIDKKVSVPALNREIR